MALASDLMGLGVAPLQAARTATGGTGPLSLAVGTATTFTAATLLGCTQFVVTATGLASGGIKLPVIGGDTGALLADDFVINNTGTSTIQIFANPSGGTVLISAHGSNNSVQLCPPHNSFTLYPVSTTQWIAIAGS